MLTCRFEFNRKYFKLPNKINVTVLNKVFYHRVFLYTTIYFLTRRDGRNICSVLPLKACSEGDKARQRSFFVMGEFSFSEIWKGVQPRFTVQPRSDSCPAEACYFQWNSWNFGPVASGLWPSASGLQPLASSLLQNVIGKQHAYGMLFSVELLEI